MCIWKQLENEPDFVYSAFGIFKKMGPARTYLHLARELSKSKSTIYRWAKKWNWHERLVEFDNFISSEKHKLESRDISYVAESQVEEIRKLASSSYKLIGFINQRLLHSPEELKEMKLENLLKLVSAFLKLVPEIHKAAEIINNMIPKNESLDTSALTDIIQTDERAHELASALLDRISQLSSE